MPILCAVRYFLPVASEGKILSDERYGDILVDTMELTRPVQAGDRAPALSLKDQNDKLFTLSDQHTEKTLLSFHPLAWTHVCAEQMRSLEENFSAFRNLNTLPVGISIDAVPCKKAWAEHLMLQDLRILADFWPHGNVAREFGIFRDANGFSERANIIVDGNGMVIFAKVYPLHTLPDINEILAFLKSPAAGQQKATPLPH
jgi:peroxiredoxin